MVVEKKLINNFIGKYDLPSRLNFSREFYDIKMVRKQEIKQISLSHSCNINKILPQKFIVVVYNGIVINRKKNY